MSEEQPQNIEREITIDEETENMNVNELRDYLIRATMAVDFDTDEKKRLYESRMTQYNKLGGTPEDIVLRMLEMHDI